MLDLAGNQHGFQRLRGREQAIRRRSENLLSPRLGDVAVPDRTASADQAQVVFQPLMEVVEQRLERADVENGQTVPFLGQHPGQEREDGRFRLAACGGCYQQCVMTLKQGADAEFLQGTKLLPAQRIDNVVLESGMELFKIAHRFSNELLPTNFTNRHK